jgi:hypothetical protein
MASFNSTIGRYREFLVAQGAGGMKLPNHNLDVGTFTAAGKYRLTDAAYSRLLHRLQSHYPEVSRGLRSDILAFYHDLEVPISTKANHDDWAKVLQELDRLRAVDANLQAPAARTAALEQPR